MKKRADGRYCKQIRINGKVVSFYGKTQAEVTDKIMNYKAERDHGRSFGVIADEWLAAYLNEVPYTTYEKCGRAAYLHAVDTFGERAAADITPAEIAAYLQKLAAQRLSQKTVATYKSILNQIFKHAFICGDVQANPVPNVPLPKNLPKSKRTLPDSDAIRIVDTMHSGFEFLAYFLMYTGLRKSEALALSYEDINRETRRIKVNKKIIYEGNKPVLVHRTKTESGERDVILLDRLDKYLPNKETGIVFCNSDGAYYTQKQLRCGWEKMKKSYGINITAHQLRHAYATMLFEAGVDVKDAQELMGHSDINLTRQIYTHIRSERKDETADKLNAFSF